MRSGTGAKRRCSSGTRTNVLTKSLICCLCFVLVLKHVAMGQTSAANGSSTAKLTGRLVGKTSSPQLDGPTTFTITAGADTTIEAQIGCSGPADACPGTIGASVPITQLTSSGNLVLSLPNVSWLNGPGVWNPVPGGLPNDGWESVVNIPLGFNMFADLTIAADPFAPAGEVNGPTIALLTGPSTFSPILTTATIISQTDLTVSMPAIQLTDGQGVKVPMPIKLQESGPSGTNAAAVEVRYPAGVSVDTPSTCNVTGGPGAGQVLNCTGLTIPPQGSTTIQVTVEAVPFAPAFVAQATGSAQDDRDSPSGRPNNDITFSGQITNTPVPLGVNDNFSTVFATSQNVTPGSQVQQTLSIQAVGDVPGPFVNVTYAGLQVNSVAGDFNCGKTLAGVTCTMVKIDAGETAQIQIGLTVTAGPGAVSDVVIWGSGVLPQGQLSANGTIVAPSARR